MAGSDLSRTVYFQGFVSFLRRHSTIFTAHFQSRYGKGFIPTSNGISRRFDLFRKTFERTTEHRAIRRTSIYSGRRKVYTQYILCIDRSVQRTPLGDDVGGATGLFVLTARHLHACIFSPIKVRISICMCSPSSGCSSIIDCQSCVCVNKALPV